ncbi:MAG: cell division ATP-binding protein FtsE [Minisyncoccia bacterium]
MIEFKNVSKIYFSGGNSIFALKDISFKIEKNEFISIIGKSGAGKTTILKLIIAQEKPDKGEVLFEGTNIHLLEPKLLQFFRRKIGVIYQDYKLLSSKTVKENVEYIMEIIGASDHEIKRDVPEVLEIVGLINKMNSFPSELSGGEKQRLAIARALIHQPDIIIADEPTGNLDIYNTLEIIEIFEKIHNLGKTVILLTHNKEVVDNLKRRVITLDQGKIISDSLEGKYIL